jgi:nitroreductase
MTNPVVECLMNHRSVRKFKPEPIDETTIRTLISAGTRAATGGNLQMYTFLVVDDEDKIALFEQMLQPVIRHPPLIIIALLDLYRIKRWLEVNESRPPILDRPAYYMLAFCDAMIALQNVVIAAESLGLGTCYCGSILEFDVQEHFGTPEYVFPAGMVCLGYPDEEPGLSQRLPLEAVIHRNSYQFFDDETIKDLYRERDRVWESVSEERKNQLRKQGINSIPQALAVQRFSNEATGERSQRILENLRRAKFIFEY